MPSGTPITFATVSPPTITASARARRCGGTSRDATTPPTAQNAPVATAVTTRATISTPYDGASAPSAWPATNTARAPSSVTLRGSRSVSTAIAGAPASMPNANADTSRPASGMDTARSAAICGSSPEIMNSVVPSAKMPSPRT